MYSDILTTLKTLDDKRALEMAIKQALPSLNQPGIDARAVVDQFIPVKFVEKINFDNLKNIDPEKYFLGLLAEIDKLEVMTITIALDPTRKLIDTVCQWLTKSLPQAPIVDLLVDPDIGAGIKIEYKGKYEDLSSQSQIEKFTNDKSL